ncbi:TVP38/TMEM64 family protein [Paenibacillus sp. D51F]
MSSHSSLPVKNMIRNVFLLALLCAVMAYLIRSGETKALLLHFRQFGWMGALIGLLVQTAVNIAPVPGEFTSVLLMEMYGAVRGGVLSYAGGVLGAAGSYWLAGMLAAPLRHSVGSGRLYGKAEELLSRGNGVSLLIARLLPYHLVNYACGITGVRFRTFIWTSLVGLIPFHLAMILLYAGVKKGSLAGVAASAVLLLLLAAAGWRYSRYGRRAGKKGAAPAPKRGTNS